MFAFAVFFLVRCASVCSIVMVIIAQKYYVSLLKSIGFLYYDEFLCICGMGVLYFGMDTRYFCSNESEKCSVHHYFCQNLKYIGKAQQKFTIEVVLYSDTHT
jgi:hypothetical protein